MRIAICEDNKEHTEILKSMINHWAEKTKVEVDVGCFQSAEQFLFLIKDDAHYDLAFLDIQLEKMSGMQLARLIRKEDEAMILVFTTGEKGYAMQGYEVSAFRYLIKPLKENEVIITLTKANKLIEKSKRDVVIVHQGKEALRVFKNDIMYVEVDNHNITIYMSENNDIRFVAKMKECEKLFEEPQFCKCHRSYIVNLHYVGKISREGAEIENGKVIPVSRARWDNLNKCYLAYYTMR